MAPNRYLTLILLFAAFASTYVCGSSTASAANRATINNFDNDTDSNDEVRLEYYVEDAAGPRKEVTMKLYADGGNASHRVRQGVHLIGREVQALDRVEITHGPASVRCSFATLQVSRDMIQVYVMPGNEILDIRKPMIRGPVMGADAIVCKSAFADGSCLDGSCLGLGGPSLDLTAWASGGEEL